MKLAQHVQVVVPPHTPMCLFAQGGAVRANKPGRARLAAVSRASTPNQPSAPSSRHPVRQQWMKLKEQDRGSDSPEHGWSRADWAASYKSQTEEINYWIEDIEGEIPAELEGTYFKNGPSRFERGGQRFRHPFDGDGAIARIAIRNGRAHARTAFVRTREFLEEEAAQKVLYRNTFGTQRAGGAMSNAFDVYQKNVANTNVLVWGEGAALRCLALWEASQPWALDPTTLGTLGSAPDLLGGLLQPGTPFGTGIGQVDGALQQLLQLGGDALTAHPHKDPTRGSLVAFSYRILPGLSDVANGGLPLETEIRLFEAAADWSLMDKQLLRLPGFGFVHDFAFTQRYFVVFQNPVKLDMTPFVTGVKGPAECLRFQSDRPLVVYLVPRGGGGGRAAGAQRRVAVAGVGCFVFHIANAFDAEDGSVVIDCVVNADISAISDLSGRCEDFVDSSFEGQSYTLRRIVVPPPPPAAAAPAAASAQPAAFPAAASPTAAAAMASIAPLGPRLVEFPRVDPRLVGRRHRYVYTTGSRYPTGDRCQPLQLWSKVDTAAAAAAGGRAGAHEAVLDFGRCGYAGEPEFVPRAGGTAEDDGWVVGFVYDSERDRTALAIAEAGSMRRVAMVWLRHRLPQGLHGCWEQQYFGPADDRSAH